MFVNEECIADSVKAYYDFEKKLLEKYPKEKRKEMKPTAISGTPYAYNIGTPCGRFT